MRIILIIFFIFFIFYIIISSLYKFYEYYKKNNFPSQKAKAIPSDFVYPELKRILKPGEYFSSPIENPNSEIDIAINHAFWVCKEIFQDKSKYFTGQTEQSLIKFQNKFINKLPNSYLQFLKYLGSSEISIYDNQEYSISGYETANEEFIFFLEDINYNSKLLENKIVFSSWQGYEFYLFENDGIQNPKVFYLTYDEYSEELYFYNYPSFSLWLLELTLQSLKLRKQSMDLNKNISESIRTNNAIETTTSLIKNFC